MYSTIQCPACQNGQITIEPHMLLQGTAFSCNSCGASINASRNSMSKLQQGVEDFDRLQNKLKQIRNSGSNPSI